MKDKIKSTDKTEKQTNISIKSNQNGQGKNQDHNTKHALYIEGNDKSALKGSIEGEVQFKSNIHMILHEYNNRSVSFKNMVALISFSSKYFL